MISTVPLCIVNTFTQTYGMLLSQLYNSLTLECLIFYSFHADYG